MASSRRRVASHLSKRLATLQELFGIDGRSLALFRVGLALVVLFDLVVRSTDLTAFYTDAGVLPRAALLSHISPWALSIHLMNGTAAVQAVLLGLQGVCAVGLLVGYRTRWMAGLSWFLIASLQRRNPLILGGADNYVRMMLFWSMFVPLDARYSLDNALKASPQQHPVRILSWGTAAILLQTTFVYVCTALYKWRGTMWQDGSALHYAFNLDLYAKGSAGWLLQFPSLLKGMTHAVLWFESLGPLLLFCPVLTGPIRTCTCVCFMLLHLSLYGLFYLELFPAISVVAMTLFLPSWCWDRVLRWSRPAIPSGQPYASERTMASRKPLLTNAIAASFLFAVVMWLVAQLMPSRVKIPQPFHDLGTLAYLDQTWTMFAPNPPRLSGWVVAPGVLQDGTRVDVSRDGAPVSWAKPPQRSLFKNERWRKYLIHFSLKQDPRVWRDYARYLCRSWNAHHAGEQRLESLDIILMARQTPPPEGDMGVYTQRHLLRDDCGVHQHE